MKIIVAVSRGSTVYSVYVYVSSIQSQTPSIHIYNPCLQYTTHSLSSPSRAIYLDNTVNHLGNEKAAEAKNQQPGSQAPEPSQIALVLLSGHPYIHAPQSCDDVHGQDDGAEHGELAEDVGGLFLALVHADIDLG